MNIKKLRLERNLTQKQLADAIGVDVSVISKYEAGTVIPPLKRLEAMAYVFGIELGQLQINSSKSAFNNYHFQQSLCSYDNLDNNHYLKRIILLGANGKCELCHQQAPFKDKEGRPYLMIHAIEQINAKKNPEKNLVALCPNCHAKLTVLANPDDVSTLKEIASQHNY